MAPLAVALSACCFFLGSFATSYVDDQVAMFQGRVQIRKDPILADVKLVQESMAVTTEILADIDETLAKVKNNIEQLESGPEWMKSTTLTLFTQTLLPAMKTMDEHIIALDHNMSSASWAWFYDTFENASAGTNDGLHDVSHAAKTMEIIGDWKKFLMPNQQEDETAKKIGDLVKNSVKAADVVVNGGTQLQTGLMWSVANWTMSYLKNDLANLTKSKEAFDASVSLWTDAMTRIANSSATSDPTTADAIAEFPVVAEKLYEDYLHKKTHYEGDFEKAFNNLEATKEMKRVEDEKKAQEALEDVKETIDDVKQGIDDAKKVASTIGQIGKAITNIPHPAPHPFHRGFFR